MARGLAGVRARRQRGALASWLIGAISVVVVVGGAGQSGGIAAAQSGACGWSENLSQAGSYPGVAEAFDRLGSASAVGDFNGDGALDVAAGVPGENNGSGAVNIFYGPCGTGGSQAFSQSGDMAGASEAGDGFGSALTTGDLNGDGRADLIVGLPGEDINDAADAGAIVVILGSSSGLRAAQSSWISEATIGGSVSRGTQFGFALASGDLNGDGYDEIIVGGPGKDVGTGADAGEAVVLFGSPRGPGLTGARFLSQRGPVEGKAESGDRFGEVLAIGNFENDSFDDLVVAAPGEAIGSRRAAGAVHILPGDPAGIALDKQIILHQSVPGVEGVAEAGDRFGAALATGRTGYGRYDDLVVGVPGEGIGARSNAGAISIFSGSYRGLETSGKIFSQNTKNVRGSSETGDEFGAAIAVVDFNSDGVGDLAVGIPGEDLQGASNGGAVQIFMSDIAGFSRFGIQADDNQLVTQASRHVPGSLESGDRFGTQLTAGGDVLLVGVPSEAAGKHFAAGVVTPLTVEAATVPKCDPSYPSICVKPSPPDLDCADMSATDFLVVQPDPHNFDNDNDGIGCESPKTPTYRTRVGAICRDGWRSYATGSGACSSHGGVSYWLYA